MEGNQGMGGTPRHLTVCLLPVSSSTVWLVCVLLSVSTLFTLW